MAKKKSVLKEDGKKDLVNKLSVCPYVAPRVCAEWKNGCPHIQIKEGQGTVLGITNCPCTNMQKLIPQVFVCQNHGIQNNVYEIRANSGKVAHFCLDCMIERISVLLEPMKLENIVTEGV